MPQDNSGWTPVDDSAINGWTPVESPGVHSTPSSKLTSPYGPKNPRAKFDSGMSGFGSRFAEATGLPKSWNEAKELGKTIARPPFLPGGMIYEAGKGYLKTIARTGVEGATDIGEAGQNIKAGQPVLPNIGKALSGLEHVEAGALSPVGGQQVEHFGEDIHDKKYAAATGGALGITANAFLSKLGEKPGINRRSDLLSSAISHDPADIKAALPELEKAAAKTGTPNTVGDMRNVIRQSLDDRNTEYGVALQPIRGRGVIPSQISSRIRAKITPEMMKTADGRAVAKELNAFANDYSKRWTLGELDGQRKLAEKALARYYEKTAVDKTSAARGDASVIANREIVDGIQEIVYPAMDKANGKPPGFFANHQLKTGALIKIDKATERAAESLRTEAAAQRGLPTSAKIGRKFSAYLHPLSGRGGVSLHHINEPLVGTAENLANKSVRQAFGGGGKGRQALSAVHVNSLPLRYLYLPEFEGGQAPKLLPPLE